MRTAARRCFYVKQPFGRAKRQQFGRHLHGGRSSRHHEVVVHADESMHQDTGSPCQMNCPSLRMLTSIAARSQAAVQKLLGMIGRSAAIYWGIVDLIVMRLRDSEGLVLGLRETALCSLRSQLLMALHDANATELCNKVRARRRKLQLSYVGLAHGALPHACCCASVACMPPWLDDKRVRTCGVQLL